MKDGNSSDHNIQNILIVDDTPANLMLLAAMLKGDGYKIRPVPNGMLALQAVAKEKPDIILLDILMPEMTGYEVCDQLKANVDTCDIPVIFISALNDTNNVVKALSSGGVDYITKPFQAEEVKARVATHLKIQRQSKELQQQSKELQIQRKELLELNATKDRFFSIIAHDLRSPFQGFLGLTQILEEELSTLTMTEIKEIAASLSVSANNHFRLLDNLLQWSQTQKGSVPFTPEVINLNSLVEDSITPLIESAKTKGIEIASAISNSLEVFADKNMLQTVIRNLVSNALKFTNTGGKVNLLTKKNDDKRVEISVQDTGIGMLQEMVGNLFRLDINTSRRGTHDEPSTGLGLLLCNEFIEKHGGKLRVESEVGKGSTFSFTLPVIKI
jgi:two-component system sensor histidine kinase/response regulator